MRSGLFALLFYACIFFPSTTESSSFEAYNDCAPTSLSKASTGRCYWNNVTFGRGSHVYGFSSGFLLDNYRRPTNVTLSIEEHSTHHKTINHAEDPSMATTCTPAYAEFAPCFCDDVWSQCEAKSCTSSCDCEAWHGQLSYNDEPGWYMTYIFEGLNPRCMASLTFYAHRGSGNRGGLGLDEYASRYTLFTLQGTSRFHAEIEKALVSLDDGKTLVVRTGQNREGHVARWTNISNNGTLSVVASHDRQNRLINNPKIVPPPHPYKAYAGGLLKLEQHCRTEETIYAVIVLGAGEEAKATRLTQTVALMALINALHSSLDFGTWDEVLIKSVEIIEPTEQRRRLASTIWMVRVVVSLHFVGPVDIVESNLFQISNRTSSIGAGFKASLMQALAQANVIDSGDSQDTIDVLNSYVSDVDDNGRSISWSSSTSDTSTTNGADWISSSGSSSTSRKSTSSSFNTTTTSASITQGDSLSERSSSNKDISLVPLVLAIFASILLMGIGISIVLVRRRSRKNSEPSGIPAQETERNDNDIVVVGHPVSLDNEDVVAVGTVLGSDSVCAVGKGETFEVSSGKKLDKMEETEDNDASC